MKFINMEKELEQEKPSLYVGEVFNNPDGVFRVTKIIYSAEGDFDGYELRSANFPNRMEKRIKSEFKNQSKKKTFTAIKSQ